MKKNNIVLTIAVLLSSIILIVLSGITYKTVKAYSNCEKCLDSILKFQEKNDETIFSIDNITYFSSSDADIKTNSNSSFTISDLYQYTDIALFINPNSKTLTAKNTLKSVKLSSIQFALKPNVGTSNLYYKNINDFATSKYSEENLINNSITFETTSENEINFGKPILYNNCANPITLTYINSKIQDEYTLNNEVSNLSHNGSLLKSCGITLNSISCKISLDVTIINNLDETYWCPITLNIPLSTENSTIYDGSLTLKDTVNYTFMRID